MNGRPAISLNLSREELEAIKNRTIVGELTGSDVFKLVQEIENLHGQFTDIDKSFIRFMTLIDKAYDYSYAIAPNLTKVQEVLETLKYGMLINAEIDVNRVQGFLARFMHTVTVNKKIEIDDQLVGDVRRYLDDVKQGR